MKKRILYISLLLTVFSFVNVYGQERLSGLQFNPVLKKKSKEATKVDISKSVFTLPFITDFAKSIGYPDTAYWVDNFAFINLTYPINPPSIGTATLDALDETGKLFSNASSMPFPADTLTSKIINLNYPVDDSIFISFYYEPGGLGDNPEINDSLLLDFYSEDSSQWYNVWNVRYNNVDTILYEYHLHNDSTYIITKDSINLTEIFQQVILPINDEIYLNDTFQFRFRNYASITASADVEGTMGNSDHWHIDYIQLDSGRAFNDTIRKDAALLTTVNSILKNYTAIPHQHYGQILIESIKEERAYLSFINYYDNNFAWNLDYYIYDMNSAYSHHISGQSGADLLPHIKTTYGLYLNYEFPFNPYSDSSLFKIQGVVEIDSSQHEIYRWNDTTTFYQKFYNYYSYDDGTAENGYGIIGEGTENAMVAMRFDSYMKDTIRGVQIYFNQNANNDDRYFNIHVWDDNNGKPGDIIYTLSYQLLPKDQELNEFKLFKFDEIVEVDEVFYVGWQKQDLTDMLNVGFDLNQINNNKLFYKFSSDWKQSELEGSVMIRPVLGKSLDIINSIPDFDEQEIKINIYPNPADNYLQVNIEGNNISNYQYEIFDSFGRIHQSNISTDSPIDISNLSPGIYFIRINYPGKKAVTKKFIIIR